MQGQTLQGNIREVRELGLFELDEDERDGTNATSCAASTGVGVGVSYIFSEYWSQGIMNSTVYISVPYGDNKLENQETCPETFECFTSP
jgi:hypothetical protein